MKKFAAIALVALPLLSAGAQADLPDKEFACKVQTASLKIGAVLVQAWDVESARELAATAEAVRVEDREREPAQMTLQCVQYPGGRFPEPEFQAFVESLPR